MSSFLIKAILWTKREATQNKVATILCLIYVRSCSNSSQKLPLYLKWRINMKQAHLIDGADQREEVEEEKERREPGIQP